MSVITFLSIRNITTFLFCAGTFLAHYTTTAAGTKGATMFGRCIVICGLALLATSCGTGVTINRDNITTSGVVATSSGLGSASESVKGISKSLTSASVQKAITGSFVAAPNFSVTVTNAMTGKTVCTAVTDSDGEYSCDAQPALIDSGLGDGIAHLYVVSLPPDGRYTIVNYVRQATGADLHSSLQSGQADPDTTVATLSLENYAKTYDSDYSIGAPLPAALNGRIQAGTFDEQSYFTAQHDYFANGSLSDDGASASFAATSSTYKCLIGLGADPASLGLTSLAEFPKKVMAGTISSTEVSAIGSFSAQRCGLDASVSAKLTTASLFLPAVQTITAQYVAGDSSFRSELTSNTDAMAAWRSVIFAASTADDLTAIFKGPSNPIASLISNAKAEGSYAIFAGEKPKVLVGYLGQANGTVDLRDSTALTTVVNTIKAVDITGLTAIQARDSGKSLQKLASADGDFGDKISVYSEYVTTNVKSGKLTTSSIATTDFTAVKTNIDVVRALHSGETASQIAQAAVLYVDPSKLATGSAAATSTQTPSAQYTNDSAYQQMCQSSLTSGGYTTSYAQYCGTKPGAVSGVGVAAGNGATTTTWTATSGATSYNLYWSTNSGVTTSSGTKISDVTSPYSHTGLANGTRYYYILTAANSHGEGTASSEVTSRPVPPVTGTPDTTSASGGNTLTTIIWSSVSGAASYNLYFSTSAGVTKSNGTKIAGVVSPYDHMGLTNGTTYYYCIGVENIGGESDCSNEFSTTPAGNPSASQSTITSSAASISSDNGQATITVTAKDAGGNIISGASVTLGATGTGNTISSPAVTNSSGVTTATYSSTKAEAKTITAVIGGVTVTQTATVTVTVGAVSPTRSTIQASEATVTANGVDTTKIRVVAKDANDNLIPNATVVLSTANAGVTLVQPGMVTSGRKFDLDATRMDGSSPCTNDPFPSTWTELQASLNATLNGFDGTTSSGCAGTGTVSDKYRIQFDGSNDYGLVSHNVALRSTNHTIEAWVNVDNSRINTNHGAAVYVKGSSFGAYYELLLVHTGNPYYRLNSQTAGAHFGTANLVTSNTWHHIAGTYDGSTMAVYVDGVRDGTKSYVTGINQTETTNVFIGLRSAHVSTPSNSDLPGAIGRVAFYSRTLSPTEIAQLYNMGADTNETGFGEGVTTTRSDGGISGTMSCTTSSEKAISATINNVTVANAASVTCQ